MLLETFRNHSKHVGGPVKIRNLLEGKIPDDLTVRQHEFLFSADDVLEETVGTEEEIEAKYEMVAEKFFKARESALKNTRFYLSMVGDLDVYVATRAFPCLNESRGIHRASILCFKLHAG